jgi:hypothetical protein
MSTIVTRSGKGSPLTHNEVDANFTNLNTDKVEKTAAAITGGTIDNTSIGATTPSTGKFSTLETTGNSTLGTGSSQYIQVEGGATAVLLSAQGAGTNIPLALQPKGTGALQAQQTDSTTAGGNARGANAVDWQTLRDAATKVASGSYSIVGGGQRNTASGSYSQSLGGFNNASSAFESVIVGGQSNIASGQISFIGSGTSNTASGYGSNVVGGTSNTGAGLYSFIGGGQLNSGTSGSAVDRKSVV